MGSLNRVRVGEGFVNQDQRDSMTNGIGKDVKRFDKAVCGVESCLELDLQLILILEWFGLYWGTNPMISPSITTFMLQFIIFNNFKFLKAMKVSSKCNSVK